MNKIGIFGSSGLAREVADIARDNGYKEIFFIDLENGLDSYTGYAIKKESEFNYTDSEIDYVIGIGEGISRKKVYEKFPVLNYVNLIHPTVSFGYKQKDIIEVTKGNIICAGTRITNNVKIGNFGLYNLNTTIGHDCIIQDFVTISPGANISGNVLLSECCYIGTGSTVLQGKSIDTKLIIGMNSTVGAGAVVVKDVEANVVVKGIPAK